MPEVQHFDPPDHDPPARWLAYTLLVAAFLTGGGTRSPGMDDAVVQLFALVVAIVAVAQLLRSPPDALGMAGIGVACLLLALPLLQLVPLSPDSWQATPQRASLAADLQNVGATAEARWTLAPHATWRAWASLLPAFAAFLAVLAFARGKATQRALLRLLVGLSIASILLGFVQLGVPQDSLLNPFPERPPVLNGVFSNPNHQGIAAVAALAIALAMLLQELRGDRPGRRAWRLGGWAFAAVFLLLALPLMGSRGAVLIAVFVVALVPVAMGAFSRRRLRSGWTARVGLVAAAGLVAMGLSAAMGWMQVDAVDELRAPLRDATAALAAAHAPLGIGMGGFVPAFEQAAPDRLLMDEYINHAHNEYLQWWAELGWLAWLAGAAVALLLAFAAARVVRDWPHVPRDIAVASLAVPLAVMGHGFVDFPLRTPALMTVAAITIGIFLNVAGSGVRAHARDVHRNDMPAPA
jgi:O-antigen ligase